MRIRVHRSTALTACTALAAGLLGPVAPAVVGMATASASPLPAIESVGPIPTVGGGSGTIWPTLPAGLAQMPRGGVVSPESPYLSVPSLRSTAEIPVRVVDVSRQLEVWSGPLVAGWTRIGATLITAREYRVEVQRATGDWMSVGGFSVAPRGAGAGPSISAGGMMVAAVSGQVTTSWESEKAIGPAGGASVALSWASNSATAVPGLPTGWQLAASPGQWARLTESTADETAVLRPGTPVAVRAAGSTSAAVSLAYPRRANLQVSRWVAQRRIGNGPWVTVPVTGLRRTATGITGRVNAPRGGGGVALRFGAVAEETTVWGPASAVVAGGTVVPFPLSQSPVALAGAGVRSLITPGDLPASVRLTGWDSSQLTFTRNALGVYEQTGGAVSGYANSITWIGNETWEFTDSDGGTTRFVNGRAARFTAKGARAAQYTFDAAGRLVSLANEIDRVISLRYAGSDTCASAGWTEYGFVAPPTGMLCGLDYPDGSSTEIGYVTAGSSAQIALIKDPGEVGSSYGWDALGRLSATRSPLATSAAAADVTAADVVTRLHYDGTGRVAEVIDAPATPGGPTARHTFDYPSISEDDLRDWDASPTAANAVTARGTTDAGDSYVPMSTVYQLDPVTWRVLSSTDPAGLTVSASTGPTLRSTTDKAGRVTTYGYDDLGQVTSVSGPVEPGAEGLRSATQRDTTRTAGGDDKPLAGLRAVVFAQPNFLGGSRSQYLPADPDRGSLSASWSGRPATFSGQAAGVWNPDDSDDAAGHADGWRFLLTASGGSDAELVVGGNLCAENVPCTVSGLPTGPKAVRVQLRRAGTSGWFQVTAAPVGRPLVVLPSTEVGPGYGLTTVAGSNDDLPGAPAAGAQTLYKYADPASSIPSSTVTPGGLATALAHEAGATGNNDWGRLTSTTTPGGRVSATAYWDDNVDATLPAPCGGGTQRQSGQVRSVTLVDGRVVQSWFDLRGQERATVITGDGLSQTYCTSYFADGAVATTGVFDTAGDLIESSATTRVSPLTTSLLVTHGPAAPVNPGTSVTTTSTVDLRGRDVSSTDAAGSTTTAEYDVLGNVTSRTTTPPAGSGSPALVVASTYRAEDGRLATVSVNGVIAATVLYDPTSGRVSRITYPNGIRTGYSWQPNGPLGSVAVVTGIADLGTVTERRTVSAFGRVESSVARTSGTLAFSEQRGYQYDAAGRLASAVISTTNGSAPAAASFAYGYGAQNAGCPTGYAGAGKDGLRTSGRVNGTAYVVCHDSLGRLSSTTSPLVTGGGDPASATHDGLGRLLTLGGARPLSLTWGVGGSVAVIDESDAGGGHSVTTTLDEYGGEILDQTVLSDAGTDTVRLSGPFRLRLTSGEVTGTASLQYGLPGGATVTLTTGSEATLSLPGVDGSALVTLPVPSLGAGTSATASIAGRFGPYGEPLADIPTDTGSALPAYTWKASARQQTMAGTSSITLLPARAYAPLVGEFLSPDPVPDAASNLYAYTDGDPVNQSDPTGGSSDDSSLTIVTGVLSAAGLFGSMWGGYAIGRYKELARFAGWGASVAGALMAGVSASLAAKSQNADNGATVAIGLAAAAGSGVASYGSYRFGVNRGRVVRNARAAQLGRDRQAQNSLKQQTKVQKFTRRGLEATERVKTEGYMGAVTNDRNVKAMVQSKYEPNVVIREEPLSTRYSSGIDGSRRGSGSVSDDLDNLSMMQGGSFVGSE